MSGCRPIAHLFSEFRAQCAAFWPLMNMAPKVGPMRGAPSSSATCAHDVTPLRRLDDMIAGSAAKGSA